MIDVIAFITIKENNTSKFIKLFKENMPHVLKEKGCIAYYPTIDLQTQLEIQNYNPKQIVVVEKWENLPSLEAHLETSHMKSFFKSTQHIVENITLKVLQEAL